MSLNNCGWLVSEENAPKLNLTGFSSIMSAHPGVTTLPGWIGHNSLLFCLITTEMVFLKCITSRKLGSEF